MTDAARHVEAERKRFTGRGRKGVGRAGLPRLHQRLGGLALDADDTRALAADQPHAFQFAPGFPHAQHTGAAAGGVDHDVRQLPRPAGPVWLGQFQAERFLAVNAPARLLERRDAEPAAWNPVASQSFPGLPDRALDLYQVKALRPAGQRRDPAEYRHRRVFRHRHDRLEASRVRILAHGIAGIALRRYRQALYPGAARHGNGHRHAAVLETLRRVCPEPSVRLAFVLDPQVKPGLPGHRVAGILE